MLVIGCLGGFVRLAGVVFRADRCTIADAHCGGDAGDAERGTRVLVSALLGALSARYCVHLWEFGGSLKADGQFEQFN